GMFGEYVVNKLGGSAITIPGNEVSVALQQGVVDGLISAPSYYHDGHWHTDYLTTGQWVMSYSIPLNVHLDWWNELPTDIQEIIENQVVPELVEYSIDEVTKMEEAVLEEIQKEPYNVEVTELNEEQIAPFRELLLEDAKDLFIEEVGETGK